MVQGFHDERRRRGQVLKILFFGLLLAVLIALMGLAYMVGLREQVLALEESTRQTQLLSAVLDRERQARAEVTAARDVALADAAALRQRIQSEVPTGVTKQLLDLARERVAAGVRPERIASALQRAENAKNCEPPAARRLTVRVQPVPVPPPPPGSRVQPVPGPIQPTIIGEQLTLLIEGQNLRDGGGQPLPAYDPAEPIQLRLTAAAAKIADVEGRLPFSHVLFSGAWEYRMSFTAAPAAAPRGQVTVAIERCPFP
jgi:hypothetical protein